MTTKDRFSSEQSPIKNTMIKKRSMLSFWVLVSFLSICFIGFIFLRNEGQAGHFVRSDMTIPTETSFINRPEFILQIDKLFKNKEGIHTVALIGQGGAGKTTLARQYAYYQKDRVVFEVIAETPGTLASSFENLAQGLAITEDDKKTFKQIQEIKNATQKEEKIIQFVREHLRSKPSWFLIFDNVEKFADIQKYFPKDTIAWGEGKIILTTRNANIQDNQHINSIISVGELNPEQKFTLFEKIINPAKKEGKRTQKTPLSDSQIADAKAFLEHIPPFPLDISVVAYYLKTTHTPYSTYLGNLARYNADFAKVEENLLKETGDYTKTRYGIITLSVQKIMQENKDFQDLLLLTSLIDSQNIPKELLEKLKNKTIVDNYILNLKQHSLITSESILPRVGGTFSIHRSTQKIALTYLTNLLELEKNKNLGEDIGKLLKNSTFDAVDKEDFPNMHLLMRHSEMFLSHEKLLSNFMLASVSGELGNGYVHLGNYKKAKELLENSIALYKKGSFENHTEYARSLVWLGTVLRDQGNYEKARPLIEESLAVYRKNRNESDPWFTRTLVTLGSIHKELCNYEKAKEVFEESVAIYKKNSIENDPCYARTIAWLGSTYIELGDFEKAKQLLEKSLVIYRKNSYENHLWFSRASAWLGTVYTELGYYENAKKHFKDVLAVYKKNSYDNNPWYAWTLESLGNVYRDLGNLEKARLLSEEAITIYKKNAYENHPWFARALRNLGQNYLMEGKLDIAESYFHKSLIILQKKKNPDQYRVLEDFADLYLKKSELEKNKADLKQFKTSKIQAISYLKQSLNAVKEHFPKNSPHITKIETKLKKIQLEII